MGDGASSATSKQPQDASESTPLVSQGEESEKSKLVLKAIASGLFLAAIVGLFLLGTAAAIPGEGTWKWRQGWIWTGVHTVIMPTTHVLLALNSPESFKSRQRPPISSTQSASDRGVTMMILFSIVSLYVSGPINTFVIKSDPFFSHPVSILGLIVSVIGIVVMYLASYQNSYATTNLEEQEGQKLVDTGMYAHVRHPMYTGLLIYVIGFVLWFDSVISIVFVACLAGALYQRMYMEEQQLHESLRGYPEYTKRVKYRLLPWCL